MGSAIKKRKKIIDESFVLIGIQIRTHINGIGQYWNSMGTIEWFVLSYTILWYLLGSLCYPVKPYIAELKKMLKKIFYVMKHPAYLKTILKCGAHSPSLSCELFCI